MQAEPCSASMKSLTWRAAFPRNPDAKERVWLHSACGRYLVTEYHDGHVMAMNLSWVHLGTAALRDYHKRTDCVADAIAICESWEDWRRQVAADYATRSLARIGG